MRRWEVIAIVGILALAFAAAAFGALRGYTHSPPNRFGPDWECSRNPYADVCVKKVPPAPPQS
jgi:hypothetical protein